MTLDNSKRLYEHYMANGMVAEAEDLAQWRPELKVAPKAEKTKKSE